MELFLFFLLVAAIYFYLKNDKSDTKIKTSYTPPKSTGSSYAKHKSSHTGGNYEVTLVESNRLLIESAIRDEKKVAFKYKDKSEQITQRTITPQRLFWYKFDEREGQMLCVEAFCHLRKSARTFALFRMTQLKLTP
jgi:predicted DNA-binding transcriptional regulator YafY